MSMIFSVKRQCAVCGRELQSRVLGSTNRLGAPDLDLRPPEMQRSTMGLWFTVCSNCGYVSPDITRPTALEKSFFRSQRYISCDGFGFGSELSKTLYRRYLICLAEGQTQGAFNAILYTAWSCDDSSDHENAVACRKLALPLIEDMISDSPKNENLQAQRADILRRAGMFDKLIEDYKNIELSDPLLQKLIFFQLDKAGAADVGCYTVADVQASL